MQFIGFLAMSFVGLTLINRVLEGAFLAASDVTILQNLTIFRPFSVLGMFTVPIPNLAYFTSGIPRLVMWDYSFFGGRAVIFQYMLYSATAAMAFLLFTLMIGMLYQFFSRVR